MNIRELPTPALLIDVSRLQRNIERMAARAETLGVRLRPHVKTHKCIEVGRMQENAGALGITVATLHEAETFAAHGFRDITWAFPLPLSRLEQVDALGRRVDLGVAIDSMNAAEALPRVRAALRVWIKVDCGYHRCGVDPIGDDALRLAERIASTHHTLAGVLSHSGDAYAAQGVVARGAVAENERATITALAETLRRAGHAVVEVSVGSTPSMTAVADLAGVTEARPGNYAYFDQMQVGLGSCNVEDCAATVLAQVVSSHPGHAVIDAGALALSKDAGSGKPMTMGEIFTDPSSTEIHPQLRVVSLSQEHGRLSGSLPVGTLVRVLPNHSCLTVACFDHCWAVDGDRVLHRWRVHNGR